MRNELRRNGLAYLLASGLITLVVVLTLALGEKVSWPTSLLMLTLAVVAAAYNGGFRPGLFATVLGVVAGSCLLLLPRIHDSLADSSAISHLTFFIGLGVLISWLYESLHGAHQDLSLYASQQQTAKESAEAWKERYEAAVHSSGSILYDSNRRTGEVVYGGDCERILGYKAEELCGNISKWISLIHPDDRGFFSSEIDRTNNDLSPYRADYRMMRKDGKIVWLRDDGHFTLKSLNQKPERIIGLVKDVTQQREIEQKMTWLSQRLTTLVDNTPLAVIEWDANFCITRWSGQAERTFGWSGEEVIGKPLADVPFVLDSDRDQFAASIVVLASSDERFVVFTSRSVLKNQSENTCQWYNSVLHDSDGNMIAVLSLVLDITERNKAEADLRESEERFRQLTDAMPQVVWTATIDGAVNYYNFRVKNFSGAERRDDGTWKWETVLHPDDRQRTLDEWNDALKAGRLYQCEHRVHMRDGSYRWHLSRALPATCAQAGETRWFGSATDIHDLKLSQEALRESEERFRAFMDNNPACAYLKDDQGRFLFVNRMLEQTSGRPLSDWIGKRDEELSLTNTSVSEFPANFLSPSTSDTADCQSVDFGGGQRHYLTCLFPVKGHDGRNMSGFISLDITDRKTAELQAEAERERVQLVADAVPALISYVDTDARYCLINRAYETWFGQKRDEMIGRTMREVVGEAAWAAILPHVTSAFSGNVVTYEAEVPYRNGGTRWISATYTPDLCKDGTVRGFVAHVNDITARRRAEDELKYQQSLLQAITDNAQTSIFLMDEGGRGLFVNPAAEEMTGYDETELIGNRLSQVIHRSQDPDTLHHNGDCPLLGHGASIEPVRNQKDVFVHRDGHTYPVLWNARSVFRDGKPIATVAEVWDVTKEKQAEQDLQAARHYLETIIEMAPTLIVVVNKRGEICMFNRACELLTGYCRDEVVGQPFLDLLIPDGDRHEFLQRFNAVEVAELCEPLEKHCFTRTGDQRLIEWRCTRLQSGGDNQEPMLLGIGVDVTGRRMMEDELREQAQRLAEADRRKDEFLATLAHELRNPLAPIRMGLELLKMAGNDPTTLESTRMMMERQTLQLITLVDDLLDVSRITRGKLELRRCTVALSEVVESAVEACRPAIAEGRHDLQVMIPSEPIYLLADPNRLAQVLSNLLNNAAKYTPQGGKIKVLARCDGDKVFISVKDNGVGIPTDMQCQIFDMFAQIDRSIERGYTGLGIGLTLVKSLVEMHGGTVEVFSEGADCGSCFTITIPVGKTSVQPNQIIDGSLSSDDQRPCRVIVVDDNKAAVDMLSQVVRMLGHDVRVASNGEEAIEIASKFLPHAMLMDIGMPRMDGHEAARTIRNQPWGRNVLLVALTGWGQDEDKRRTKEAGFDYHLVKPAEPAEISRLLSMVSHAIP